MDAPEPFLDIDLPLPDRRPGKVRVSYRLSDGPDGEGRRLFVTTDRLSAFDRIIAGVPYKGQVLNQLAAWWFAETADIVPNHLTGEDPLAVVEPDEREQLRGRAMLVRRLRPVPVEAVVRGYLAGSGHKEYAAHGTVCGVALPAGLKLASRLPEPIFTPATKAAVGEHDENISFEQMAAQVGPGLAARIREVALALYARAAAHALARGIIIADTKFEFGLDEQGTLVLMDEVLTPDSSRFWPMAGYAEGRNPPSLDKQPLRDWLEARAARLGPDAWPQADDPQLHDTLAALARGYADVLQRLAS